MTIGIDIRATTGKRAGKGWMIYYLVEALSKLPTAQQHQFVLFTEKEPEFESTLPNNFSVAKIKLSGIRWHLEVAKRLNREDTIDIYLSPASYIVPARVKNKCVVIIHDLVSRLFPAGHNRKAVLIERMTLKPSLKKALRVIAISENTKRDLEEHFQFLSGKVRVAPLAAGPAYRPINDQARLQQVRRAHKLPEKFILFVGTLEPRKNIVRIIQAFGKLTDKNLHLVIAGNRGWQWSDIYEEVERLGLQGRIIFLGYLSREDLVSLYSLAQVFVFPSLYEGFGLPVLEAMQSGCPVVTSKTSSLPEVAGEAAILVDPKKTEAITKGIQVALENQDDLIAAGITQARKFSWQKTAQTILDNIEEVYEK